MALHHSLKIDLWWQLFHYWKENSRKASGWNQWCFEANCVDKVCQQKAIVTNADSFINAVSESNICIVNVSTSDLQNRVEALSLTKVF